MRYCLVHIASGLVVTVVDFGVGTTTPQAVESQTPPPGHQYIQSDTAGRGWTYLNGVFTGPLSSPPPAPPIADLDNSAKAVRALALVVRDYCNALKAETRGLAVLLVTKGVCTPAEANALATYVGSGVNGIKTPSDMLLDFTTKFNSLP